MKCRKETESEEKRCTLLQYPVKLGTRSVESCTKVFVILWRVTASSFEHCKDNFMSVRCDLFWPLGGLQGVYGDTGTVGTPPFFLTHACVYLWREDKLGDIFPCRPHFPVPLIWWNVWAWWGRCFRLFSLSCVFFQKFRPDIILWEGRGKMIFPPNYIARACVRNWGLSLLSPLSLLGRAGMNCHL